jgi:hypothetical protein
MIKVLAFTALGVVAIAPSPDAKEIAARLRVYLLAYEPKLSELIADEAMTQTDRPGGQIKSETARSYDRSLSSEVAFLALPGSAGWLGFRHVLKHDNRPVDDGAGSLGAGLSTGPANDFAKARAMLADSARFNLGAPRTTNLPNLPLELLHPRHAQRFDVRSTGRQKLHGFDTTRLVFVEVVAPTIIQAPDGGQMRSIITAWVETANGRLWRADVVTRDTRSDAPPFDAKLSVHFIAHRDLGVLVPDRMHEEFYAGLERRAWGEAKYSNYRRFQTTARIVPQ